ncbi:MAG: SGNH/GDSL hydrolase family protein [Candidatus Dormibacteria bacterium]
MSGLAFVSEAVLVAPPTSAGTSAGSSGLYLDLGDSLAAGCTASAATTCCPPQGTIAGYVTDIVRSIKSRRLTTVDLGCPGETTTSMIAGGRCQYILGGLTYSSQLAEAKAWLSRARRAHRPTLVTIDLGANDLRACLPTRLNLTISPACLTKATDTASRNLAVILTELKGADPKAQIVGMTYYDPVLAAWLTGQQGRLLTIGSPSTPAPSTRRCARSTPTSKPPSPTFRVRS